MNPRDALETTASAGAALPLALAPAGGAGEGWAS